MSADCFAPLGIIPNAFAPRFARVPNPLWRMLARTVLILASEDYDHERHRRHNAANAVGLPVEPLRVRRRAAGPKTLWVCTYRNSQIPILATDCDTCTCFEFQPPLDALHEDTPRCHDAAL